MEFKIKVNYRTPCSIDVTKFLLVFAFVDLKNYHEKKKPNTKKTTLISLVFRNKIITKRSSNYTGTYLG